MFTRRTATVMISAPAASVARRVSSNERYLPEPVMSRERYVLPANTNGSSSAISPTSDEMDDLDRVAVVQHGRGVGRPRDDLAIELDGDAARTEAQRRDQIRHRRALGEARRLVVYCDLHHRESGTISA